MVGENDCGRREGMVVKPLNFTAKGNKGLVQPGIKCRAANIYASNKEPLYRVHESVFWSFGT
jgi:hypothetical protein